MALSDRIPPVWHRLEGTDMYRLDLANWHVRLHTWLLGGVFQYRLEIRCGLDLVWLEGPPPPYANLAQREARSSVSLPVFSVADAQARAYDALEEVCQPVLELHAWRKARVPG